MKAPEILDEMEDILRGECACDFITKEEMMDILDSVDEWLENAKPGDVYCYGNNEFILEADEEDEEDQSLSYTLEEKEAAIFL